MSTELDLATLAGPFRDFTAAEGVTIADLPILS
jgi:hypothetical protein